MNTDVQTWHYGAVARHWAENNTTGPEIAYYQRQIEQHGQPALDAGCGTGRLLIPLLRAGLDVDGCDVSGDMLAYCQQTAEREGLSPKLYQQALHGLNLPRHYQTIFACGAFGIGVSRQQDFMALQRFYDHLLPGGLLILENHPAYGQEASWPMWQKDARKHLPEPWPEYAGNIPEDDTEYELYYRLVAVNPLEQQTTGEMRTVVFKDKQIVSDTTFTLTSNFYFRHELQMLLEKAGFKVEAVEGGWTDADVTADDDVMVYFARKS
ncbi:MAG: methyltransferase domain-containing protein [Anaerolineaceae bacterium]|nr:methyltransferase domain-containing protein [Anaerolineaceae bacterium]